MGYLNFAWPAIFILSACASPLALSNRYMVSAEIAADASMQAITLRGLPFGVVHGYKKLSHKQRKFAHIYIEGDGLAWLGRMRPSRDPTPTDPVALRLASQHALGDEDVFYFARPCQYLAPKSHKTARALHCDVAYWTSHRYANDIVQGYAMALTRLKQQYNYEAFILHGYSGGGTIALLSAAELPHMIKAVNTYAGNLAPHYHADLHHVDPLHGSRDPTAEPKTIQTLSTIPQIHYVGGHDKIVPIDIAQYYISKFKSSDQISIKILPEYDHSWR